MLGDALAPRRQCWKMFPQKQQEHGTEMRTSINSILVVFVKILTAIGHLSIKKLVICVRHPLAKSYSLARMCVRVRVRVRVCAHVV
jgi:hypothetical protein